LNYTRTMAARRVYLSAGRRRNPANPPPAGRRPADRLESSEFDRQATDHINQRDADHLAKFAGHGPAVADRDPHQRPVILPPPIFVTTAPTS